MTAPPHRAELRHVAAAGLAAWLASFAATGDVLGDEDRQRTIHLPGTAIVLRSAGPSTNADPANPASPEDVITQRFNNLRTGTTVRRGINASFVADGRFGWLASLKVDGAVLAQPLYMASVDFPSGRRPAVFIATSTNWIYAYDADTFEQLWARQLAPPLRIDDAFSDQNMGNCTPQMATTEQEDRAGIKSVVIGIEATPAIDPGAQRMLVSYRAGAGAQGGTQRVTAIDLRTGLAAQGPAGTSLDRPVADNVLWQKLHRSRASLLIEKGIVYIGFSARCEGTKNGFNKSYQGWIYAFDTRTLAFAGRYRTTQSPAGVPTSEPSSDPIHGGGIWQASTGPASDGHGNLFFATGNARGLIQVPDAGGKNLSSSVIRSASGSRRARPGNRIG